MHIPTVETAVLKQLVRNSCSGNNPSGKLIVFSLPFCTAHNFIGLSCVSDGTRIEAAFDNTIKINPFYAPQNFGEKRPNVEMLIIFGGESHDRQFRKVTFTYLSFAYVSLASSNLNNCIVYTIACNQKLTVLWFI